MLGLYNTAILPLRLLVAPVAAWQGRDPRRRQEWQERRALRPPDVAAGGVWLHGASVGEARIVGLLASRLRDTRPRVPLAVSAFTPTGRASLPAPPEVDAAFFLPLDFAAYVRRALDAVRPSVLGLVETELWPNLLEAAYERRIPVVLLNGRLSPGRMARYRRWSWLYRPRMARLSRVGAQSEEDAQRFISLGVDEATLEVTGNIKYDLPVPGGDADELRGDLRLPPGRPVFVAGSTGPGEESLVLEAFQRARRGCGDLLLVLAPRHTQRCGEVAKLLDTSDLPFARLSERATTGVEGRDVLLVDTVGDLSSLYRIAWVAFVGGSLVPVGGHNVLEPASVGVPVLFGPHTAHVADPASTLERAGAALRVRDAEELGRVIGELVADGERRETMAESGRRVLAANRGSLARSLALLEPFLDRGGARPDAGSS